MNKNTKEKLCEFLFTFLTEERKTLFENVLRYRTRHLTVVLENIFQPHNASAVMRSCDLTGVQDVHIIEKNNKYVENPQVAMGSTKWLNIIKYNEEENNTLTAINNLKSQGYKIIATTPHQNSNSPFDLPLEDKTALIFGTELTGLSQEALNVADDYMRLPQYGFTESYNISVSVALSLFTLVERLHNSNISWQLSPNEILDIKLEWAKRTIKRSDLIIEEFLKNL
ncbi:MAG: rRNA methyltransferase [Marinilabiliales bacterium]|nr:MAG: rRNA methyltransferase [Marinilabiliales bacterium]